MALLLLCSDATEVALPKENTIWKSDFNCLISRKRDFSHINASIDATEVALPKENAIWKAERQRGREAEDRETEDRKQKTENRERAVLLGLLLLCSAPLPSVFCFLFSAPNTE